MSNSRIRIITIRLVRAIGIGIGAGRLCQHQTRWLGGARAVLVVRLEVGRMFVFQPFLVRDQHTVVGSDGIPEDLTSIVDLKPCNPRHSRRR